MSVTAIGIRRSNIIILGNSKYNRSYLARVKKVWPDAQAQIAYASGEKSGVHQRRRQKVSRIAGLGFEDLPMPSVLDGNTDQGGIIMGKHWLRTRRRPRCVTEKVRCHRPVRNCRVGSNHTNWTR